jgi:hypothetical protein
VLRRAWEQVIQSHPVLRTSFAWQEHRALQIVWRKVELGWEEQDWQAYDAATREQRLETFLADDRARSFDISRAPLLRFTVLRVGPTTHTLVFSFHHALLDGWSLGMLFKEVLAAYEHLQRGEAPERPSRRPYRDYIAWLQQQDLAAAESFWRERLAGFDAPTPWPLTGGRPTPGFDELVCQLSAESTAALQSFAQQHRLTVNTLLQGAWALLLSRYTGTGDVVFGATMAGRPPELPGAENMMGLFINTLPVRVKISPEARLAAWLEQIQQQQTSVTSYSYSPLGQVQRWSAVPPAAPLFETLLVFENYPLEEALGPRSYTLGIRGMRVVERSNYPLTVAVGTGRQLQCTFTFDTQRCGRAAVERMAGHLLNLLRAFVRQGSESLAAVAITSAPEQAELRRWSQAAPAEAPEAGIAELFTAQAARTPHAIAVETESGPALTYAALQSRVDRLAAALRARGAAPEQRIGVCVSSPVARAAAWLGVLRSGAVYVPLDPSAPASRLAWILADAEVSLVVVEPATREHLPADIAMLDADPA